jgi:Flp pilus assembly protein TadB
MDMTAETGSRDMRANSRRQTADSRQQTADSRQETRDKRQETRDKRQQPADSRQQTADSRQYITDLGASCAAGLVAWAVAEKLTAFATGLLGPAATWKIQEHYSKSQSNNK